MKAYALVPKVKHLFAKDSKGLLRLDDNGFLQKSFPFRWRLRMSSVHHIPYPQPPTQTVHGFVRSHRVRVEIIATPDPRYHKVCESPRVQLHLIA